LGKSANYREEADTWAEKSTKWETHASAMQRECEVLAHDMHDRIARMKEEEINKTAMMEAEREMKQTILELNKKTQDQERQIRELRDKNVLRWLHLSFTSMLFSPYFYHAFHRSLY
jgi:predicted RNase H-like nuclease (RuvC/YqgF family)